jgi:hypothetical protein
MYGLLSVITVQCLLALYVDSIAQSLLDLRLAITSAFVAIIKQCNGSNSHFMQINNLWYIVPAWEFPLPSFLFVWKYYKTVWKRLFSGRSLKHQIILWIPLHVLSIWETKERFMEKAIEIIDASIFLFCEDADDIYTIISERDMAVRLF